MNEKEVQEKPEEQRNYNEQTTKAKPLVTPHDEAFKKLLQTFFREFIQLFFPEVDRLLDYSKTRFLMQELLVDIVGQESRELDLLIETKYKASDAYVLIHIEPQSYRDTLFHERMFIYFSRLFERHRREHKLIIPIAIFIADDAKNEPNKLIMDIPQHPILHFQFLKVELRNIQWRQFIDSDNPVAAALLAKMGYTKEEKREVRLAYLRMLFRLQKKLDPAQLALMMSVFDIYYKPDVEEDRALLRELREVYPEEGEALMELMPAWKKWGYEEGIQEGILKGREEGREEGRKEGMLKGMEQVAVNMLREGLSPTLIMKMTGLPIEMLESLQKQSNENDQTENSN